MIFLVVKSISVNHSSCSWVPSRITLGLHSASQRSAQSPVLFQKSCVPTAAMACPASARSLYCKRICSVTQCPRRLPSWCWADRPCTQAPCFWCGLWYSGCLIPLRWIVLQLRSVMAPLRFLFYRLNVSIYFSLFSYHWTQRPHPVLIAFLSKPFSLSLILIKDSPHNI